MEPVELRLRPRKNARAYLIEQGIPILPIDPSEVDSLRLLDEKGIPIPADIEHDGRNERGETVWVRVATSVDASSSDTRVLTLATRPDLPKPGLPLDVKSDGNQTTIANANYRLTLASPGSIVLATEKGDLILGEVDFQLWADARSIIGGGAGTCRLSYFVPVGWTIEEQTPWRCLAVLKGGVRKYKTARLVDPEWHEDAQFDCELELICYAFSPVIRYRWRAVNYTTFQAHLERYCLKLPLARGARVNDGDESDDGKYLRWIDCRTPGGALVVTANFVESLGAGAGINAERRQKLSEVSVESFEEFAAGGMFEPHRFLSAREDNGCGLDLVIGGVNPPFDGNMAAEVPEVHRLFYQGMGRTFEGSILANCGSEIVESELKRAFFEIDPNHYSITGALPENGDPVYFGPYRDYVMRAAEWMLQRQWKGTLWWGEWWRGWDLLRRQGTESTANANQSLGPLYHYWRTGDERFIECARRALEYQLDVQLYKQRGGLGLFFHSRRYLIDKMLWVHMRYQRIEGSIKAAHFFGDRRARNLIIEGMRDYARKMVCPNGAPGYGEGGARGKRVPAGADCTNFGEVLTILYRETGDEEMLKLARKMANWTIREMSKWDWDAYVGNSYGWHFLMRGMLNTIKLTGNKRMREWYLDMARRNMRYPMEQIEFVLWMDWLIVEAEKMSGELWLLDELRDRTAKWLVDVRPDGNRAQLRKYPETHFETYWYGGYDAKLMVSYLPVLAARRKALGLPD